MRRTLANALPIAPPALSRRALLASLPWVAIALTGCGGGNSAAPPAPADQSTPPAATPPAMPPAFPTPLPGSPGIFGVDLALYAGGKSPDLGQILTPEEVRAEIVRVKDHVQWVRTYGSLGGQEHAGPIAREYGLKTALGAWIGRDTAANQAEVQTVIALALAGHADIVVVGSEALLRSDIQKPELISLLDQVRMALAGTGVLVTYADVHHIWLQSPELLPHVDLLYDNLFPYWNALPADDAVPALHRWWAEIRAFAGTTPCWVSETGMPSVGEVQGPGAAVPSEQAAARYFLEAQSWAKDQHVPLLWFSSKDEPFKIRPNLQAEGHWGLWSATGLKPGMQAVLDGQFIPDFWSNPGLPGGPGTPSLVFTSVPAIGSQENLEGRVYHVVPDEHRVATLIRVDGLLWTKPTAAAPATTLGPASGYFTVDLTTGGSDDQATEILCYLVPASYAIPIVLGASKTPPDLVAAALASLSVVRTP